MGIIADIFMTYQYSPIIFSGGVAKSGVVSIAEILNLGGLELLIGSQPFGSFRVLPGHSLQNIKPAMYPLASQSVAANATITDPLEVSLEMLVPATASMPFSLKLATITALKLLLDQHTSLGGSYNVLTPSFIYTGCLLTSLVDASDTPPGGQTQTRYIWNFVQPLITTAAATAAANNTLSQMIGQTAAASNPALAAIGGAASTIQSVIGL